MRKPTPVLRTIEGEPRWALDLRRPWGLGQYTLVTPGLSELLADAIHESYEILTRERDAAETRSRQTRIAFDGPTIREVARSRDDERRFATAGGRTWARWCIDRVIARWGGTAVRAFRPPAGFHLGEGWRDELAVEGAAPKTRRNLLNELWALLAFAHDERDWLDAVPRKPSACREGETLASPDQRTVPEAEFRQIRAELYSTHDRTGDLCASIPDRARRLDVIERRRLYLSFAFYTGMRAIDLDAVDDSSFDPLSHTYYRTGRKTRARRAGFEAPEQLALDVQAELARLGRPFRPREPICGGPWPKGCEAMQAAARRLGLSDDINFRSVLRRSTARELLIRGNTYQEVANMLGQASTAMLEQVYAIVPPRLRSSVRVPWDRESSARLFRGEPVTANAKVLRMAARPAARRLQSVGDE